MNDGDTGSADALNPADFADCEVTGELEAEDLDTADLDTADLDTADLDTADLDTAELDTGVPSESVVREFVVPDSAAGMRIDLFLCQCCDGFSRTQIRAAVQNEGADVDGRIIRPSLKLKAGQRVRFRVPPLPEDDTVPENIPLDVLYEDDGLVVVNKPPGMVVHPARGNWTGTLTSALAYRFQSLSDVGGPPVQGSFIGWIETPAADRDRENERRAYSPGTTVSRSYSAKRVLCDYLQPDRSRSRLD